MADVGYVANDNIIELLGLADAEGTYQNDGTVQLLEVKGPDGAVVTGVTFPVTMPYVADSSGDYRATLQDTLALVHGRSYVAVITVDAGGLQGRFEIPFFARKRTVR